MPEPFKNLLDARVVRDAARHLARAMPAFDAATFVRLALDGLQGLEFKARAMQIAGALEATLPDSFDDAAAVIEAALAPVAPAESVAAEASGGAPGEAGALAPADGGLAGWIGWPLGEFIARRGIAEPERALRALHALTQRFTAEFAIRPFIVAHPAVVFATLARWAHDPSPHVRRLVSEGSRPRLPWGVRLQALVADPSPTLPLLRALQDDPSAYVRRSVANHLNDIAKDHPDLVSAWLDEHLPGADAARRALLRHASRTLVKQGHARALAAWGHGERFQGVARLRLKPARVAVGGELTLTLTLGSTARRPQTLAVDVVLHHVKADGRTSPKVFKGWTLTLAPGETRVLTRRHSLKPVTTRRYHAGRHGVTIQANGQAVAEASFLLTAG